MLNALRKLLAEVSPETSGALDESEQRQLQLAVAGLLHEMMRVDLKEKPEEAATAVATLSAMFGLADDGARLLLDHAGGNRFTSYFAPASIIKRLLSVEQRAALIEELWRVAFADGDLDVYEDHFVRKIAHLLYVSNTDCMLARQRAKKPQSP